MTAEMRDAIATVEAFLNGTGNMWTWDDFLSVPPLDPAVTILQGFCRKLRSDYPPENPIAYCSDEGKAVLRRHIDEFNE